MTVEEFIDSIRDALPFLHKLDRGQRRAFHLFGGPGDGIGPNVNLQSAVTVSHNKTVDIIGKCDTVLEKFGELSEAISAVHATEFPDPGPTPISEQNWEDAQTILGEIGAAYGEIVEVPLATSLNLTVLPLKPKEEHPS